MNCDSDIKEEIKESMRLPWMKKPFYKTNAKDTTPTGKWHEKRSSRLSRRLWRRWYDFCDDYADIVLCCLLAAVIITGVAVYATWPR